MSCDNDASGYAVRSRPDLMDQALMTRIDARAAGGEQIGSGDRNDRALALLFHFDEALVDLRRKERREAVRGRGACRCCGVESFDANTRQSGVEHARAFTESRAEENIRAYQQSGARYGNHPQRNQT